MMKEGGRGNSSRLVNVITRVLVVGQIAMTAALLIASALQIRSIRNQVKLDYGYDEEGVLQPRAWVSLKAIIRRKIRAGSFSNAPCARFAPIRHLMVRR